MMDSGLFAAFDASQVAAIVQAQAAERENAGKARAQRMANRHQLRRATAEKHLADILPARFTDGESWHVLSHGDIDALSYLRHVLAGVEYLDRVLLSTWCIAKADLDEICAWLDAGRIERFELYAGEIFPSQYGDEYEQMLKMVDLYDCRLVIAKNHSKVTLASNAALGYYVAIESSANVNTNPRIEQSAIHCGVELHDFYAKFFAGLKSIDRASIRARQEKRHAESH